MEIKEAQKKVDSWIKTTGVRYFSELYQYGYIVGRG